MCEQALVSVILPTHNRVKYIRKAVDTVLGQIYKNIELIIVDDASVDGTYGIISELSKKDPRILVLANENNLGLAGTLNKGIKFAKGKYIARLDDDDLWIDEKKLAKQVDFLEKNKDCALVGGGAIRTDQNGNETMRYLMTETDKDIRKTILLANPFIHATIVLRKDIFEKVGGYDKHFDGFEDWDLWLKIGRENKFYNMPEFFVYYSGHEENKTSYLDQKYTKTKQRETRIELIKKYRNDYSGYKKAVVLCWLSFFFYFFPFQKKLWPLLHKIKILLFNLRIKAK